MQSVRRRPEWLIARPARRPRPVSLRESAVGRRWPTGARNADVVVERAVDGNRGRHHRHSARHGRSGEPEISRSAQRVAENRGPRGSGLARRKQRSRSGRRFPISGRVFPNREGSSRFPEGSSRFPEGSSRFPEGSSRFPERPFPAIGNGPSRERPFPILFPISD